METQQTSLVCKRSIAAKIDFCVYLGLEGHFVVRATKVTFIRQLLEYALVVRPIGYMLLSQLVFALLVVFAHSACMLVTFDCRPGLPSRRPLEYFGN
jgi:hypothetical protein